MSDISAAILVGGRARRFDGEFKPALRVGGKTILERQLRALHDARIDDILVVGQGALPIAKGFRHVPDVIEDQSALVGMYSALLHATSPVVVILAGDLPFVASGLITRLTQVQREHDAVVPRSSDGWHPLCASYRRQVAMRLKARIDRHALRVIDALDDLSVREIAADELAQLDPTGMMLMNINTPNDRMDAERHAQSHRTAGQGGT